MLSTAGLLDYFFVLLPGRSKLDWESIRHRYRFAILLTGLKLWQLLNGRQYGLIIDSSKAFHNLGDYHIAFVGYDERYEYHTLLAFGDCHLRIFQLLQNTRYNGPVVTAAG